MRKKLGLRHVVGLLAVGVLAVLVSAALAAGATTARGIVPTEFAGNFVAPSDDLVCSELVKRNLTPDFGDSVSFKVDPPASYSDSFVEFTLTNNGTKLDWLVKNGAQMVAVIVKGGTNYNLYSYVKADGTLWGYEDDQGLTSPALKNGKYPQISHYNVCYQKPLADGGQGCTPGYWRNHQDRWAGYAPADDFDLTFSVDAFIPDKALGQAVELGGGGVNALARHAVAALLNAAHPDVAYPYDEDQVKALVQAALAEGGDIEGTKNELDRANNLGCPLGGTSANPGG